MNAVRTRMIALTALAVIGVLVLAACGSSSTSSSSSSSAAAAGGPGGTGNSAARTKLTTCLKKHGVTLPTRPAGVRPGTGTTGGGGAPPGGGYGGSGTGRRGFFGGGGAGGRFNNPKFQAAFKACGGTAGFRGRPGGAGGGFRPTQAAITKFAACAKQHGYTLPKANLTGKGPIYPASIEKNAKFQAAAKACQSLLRPAGGGGAPGGAPPGGGSSTTSGT